MLKCAHVSRRPLAPGALLLQAPSSSRCPPAQGALLLQAPSCSRCMKQPGGTAGYSKHIPATGMKQPDETAG
eukprot:gene25771-biopygen10546